MKESPEPAASDDQPPRPDRREDRDPSDPRPKASAPLRWLFTVLIALALAAGGFQCWVTYPRGSVSGQVQSAGAPHGSFVVTPVTCFSGDHWGFDGVWVVTETESRGGRSGFRGGLKIVSTGAGDWNVYVENPNRCSGFQCEQWHVPRQHCPVFDVTVERRHVWLRYSGHANIECGFPEGGTLTTTLTFDDCGWVPSSGGDV